MFFPWKNSWEGRRSDMISFKKIPFKLLVKTRTLIIQHHIFCQSFGCRAVRFEDVLILILTNRSSSVFFSWACIRATAYGIVGKHVGSFRYITIPHTPTGQMAGTCATTSEPFRQESRALLVGTEDLFKAAMFPHVFSVNRGDGQENPTFLVGVLLFAKNNPRKDFPSWRVRWVYPRQYLGCVIFSVISVSGFYHGKAPDFSPPCRGRFCWP